MTLRINFCKIEITYYIHLSKIYYRLFNVIRDSKVIQKGVYYFSGSRYVLLQTIKTNFIIITCSTSAQRAKNYINYVKINI
jgi:hypothetical protein